MAVRLRRDAVKQPHCTEIPSSMNPMNRRRFILKSLGASLALPALPSLLASAVGGSSTVQTAKGAGAGARRFVAVGNLLGYQVKQLFPETTGTAYEQATLLKPLWETPKHQT